VEIPITVTPIVRLPFFATFLLTTGFPLFQRSYKRLRRAGRAIQFQFHLSDFVDYGHPELADQVPAASAGVYVPQALRTPLAAKLDLFQRAIDLIAADHTFVPLVKWADAIAAEGTNR
ncbi:MAG TPA: hypothetical protein VMU84_21080, partial [Thermoanaerobaculia bacterium]|nr:hypothetical protein [Thermoanaerobaculia bacterium]